MLRIRNLESGYGALQVLKRVSLHVSAGEIVAIIGANGAGKTTLLHTVAGLVEPTAGTIQFDRTAIAGWPAERMATHGCVLVPEGRQVFAPLSVRENLLLGACARRGAERHQGRPEDLDRMYGYFPILRERERQLAGTLSGGQQQMLAIGRALMARPSLIMMDEPSLGLAPLVVKDIFKIIVSLRAAGHTILLIEQNAKAALAIADRGYVLETGQCILEGTADELLRNHDIQRAYLGNDYRTIDE